MKNDPYFDPTTLAGRLRQRICLAVTQPMTASQLSEKLGRSLSRCSKALLGLKSHRILKCLNPKARRNRVFWLTFRGKRLRRRLNKQDSADYDCPDINWKLYGKVCFNQRSQVIKVMGDSMQPSEIKRKAARIFPKCKMSANNVRDVVRFLTRRKITRRVELRKRKHPGYKLTKIGSIIRRLLLRVSKLKK